MTKKVDEKIKKVLKENNLGIKLDIGCGGNKQEGFVGLDIRPLKGVDIVQDLEKFPWALPDKCASLAVASHVIEHINPQGGTFIKFMDEVWRVLKPGARFAMVFPYAGSQGYWQDPTHCNQINETTFAYFDPLHKSQLWTIYKPKPWYYRFVSFDPNGNIEILMMRHSENEDEWQKERTGWGPMRLE